MWVIAPMGVSCSLIKAVSARSKEGCVAWLAVSQTAAGVRKGDNEGYSGWRGRLGMKYDAKWPRKGRREAGVSRVVALSSCCSGL
jgi:hypothetical protein